MPTQPIVIRNRHAIGTGRGVIRSRYLPDADVQAAFPKIAFFEGAQRTIDVTTVLGSVRRTIMTFTVHNLGVHDATA